MWLPRARGGRFALENPGGPAAISAITARAKPARPPEEPGLRLQPGPAPPHSLADLQQLMRPIANKDRKCASISILLRF